MRTLTNPLCFPVISHYGVLGPNELRVMLPYNFYKRRPPPAPYPMRPACSSPLSPPDPETRRSRVGSGTLSSLEGAGEASSGLPSPAALASLQAPLLGSRAAAARVAASDDRSSNSDYVEV